MVNWFSKLLPRVGISAAHALAAGGKRKTSAEGKPHGVPGTDIFGGTITREEYCPDLLGRAGVEVYEKMRRSDGQIRAMLQVIKLPLRAAVWTAAPPKNGDAQDQAIADFVQQALFDDDAMDTPWDDVLQHILLQLDYGFSVLESVFRVDDEGHYRLQRLSPRLPRTIYYWDVYPNGDLRGVWQYAPVINDSEQFQMQSRGVPAFTGISNYQYLYIPAEDMTVFTFQKEGNNYEGISLLRTVYKHWWYKDLLYHIDAVRNDRFGVGIPTANLEEGHNLNEGDLGKIEEILKNLRANEQGYLVAPPRVAYSILTPDSSSGGGELLKMIDHQDAMIARNVLAGFLTLGRDARGHSAYGTRLTDFFISSLYGVANGVAADLKGGIVKKLCNLNFSMQGREYPSVVVRDLESQNLQQIVEVVLKAVGSLLTPDDTLEDFIRTSLKLPPRPETMQRSVDDRLKTTVPTVVEKDPAAALEPEPKKNDDPDDEDE